MLRKILVGGWNVFAVFCLVCAALYPGDWFRWMTLGLLATIVANTESRS